MHTNIDIRKDNQFVCSSGRILFVVVSVMLWSCFGGIIKLAFQAETYVHTLYFLIQNKTFYRLGPIPTKQASSSPPPSKKKRKKGGRGGREDKVR